MVQLGMAIKRYFGITIFGVLVCLISSFVISAHVHAIEGETIYDGNIAQTHACEEEECGLRGDDDYSEAIPIGFNFDFYGNTFTEVYVNINGALHFGCPSSEYSNDVLPVNFDGDCDLEGEIGSTQPLAILPFWDDIITTPKNLTCTEDPIVDTCDEWNWSENYSSILYRTVGDAGSRKFIVQWTNMHLYSDPNIPLGTFQVILYEGSNEFQIQYRNLLGDPDRSQGSSATVGIQNNISNFTQYSFEGTPPLASELALRFSLGEGYAVDDEASYDLVYLSSPDAPSAPELTSPVDASTGIERNPTLQWSSSTNADTYTLTVSRNEGFSDLVFQEFDLEDTEYSITELLDENTTYYWNVRATNEVGDVYSDVYTFTTGNSIAAPDDNDGIDQTTEDASPNTGDANDDGIPDAEQPNVTSVLSPTSNKYVSLQSNCTDNYNVQIGGESATSPDENYTYPAGLIGFVLRGCTVGGTATITQYYYGSYDLAKITLRKWQDNTYKTVPGAVFSSVVIGGQPAVKVVYQITDGSSLDDDGIADGNIVDPAGMAVLGASVVDAPNTGIERVNSTLTFILLIVSGGLMVTATTYGRNIFEKKQ